MSKLIDHVVIEVSSGDGGNGLIAWRREKYEPMGGPAGGNGGNGGSVFLEAVSNLNTLLEFRYKSQFSADNGQKGASANRHGKNASDLTLKVPVGTIIQDADTQEPIADLSRLGDRVLVAEGGRGGRGNSNFASPTNRAPYFCEPGESGIRRRLTLELKLLADVGLIGLPNAGKSTLLKALSRAKPKIAAYPFSTLEPSLGVVEKTKGQPFVAADIPGLIEGAAKGIGLGHEFLRHVERTRLLIHVIDCTSDDPLKDIETINRELILFDEKLATKKQIIALNKIDLLDPEDTKNIYEALKTKLPNQQIIAISAEANLKIDELITLTEETLAKYPAKENDQTHSISPDPKAVDHGDSSFLVSRHNKKFIVEGARLERIMQVTDFKSPESIHHFNKVLRSMGVVDELIKQNVHIGDDVQIGNAFFTFGEGVLM